MKLRLLALLISSALPLLAHASALKIECADYLRAEVRAGAEELNELLSSGLLEERKARTLAQRFADICPTGKKPLAACENFVADIRRMREGLMADAVAEFATLIENALGAPSAIQFLLEEHYAALELCERKPLRFDCRMTARVVRDILDNGLARLEAQERLRIERAAANVDAGIQQMSFLAPEIRALVLDKMSEARVYVSGLNRLQRYSVHGIEHMPLVDTTVVFAMLLGDETPSVIVNSSKVKIVSSTGRYMIVLDAYLRYFTIRKLKRDYWIRFDQWHFDADGKFRRSEADELLTEGDAWVQATHFRY